MLATTFCFNCPPQSCLHFDSKAEAVGFRFNFNFCPPVKTCAVAARATACNRAVLNETLTSSVTLPYTPKSKQTEFSGVLCFWTVQLLRFLHNTPAKHDPNSCNPMSVDDTYCTALD